MKHESLLFVAGLGGQLGLVFNRKTEGMNSLTVGKYPSLGLTCQRNKMQSANNQRQPTDEECLPSNKDSIASMAWDFAFQMSLLLSWMDFAVTVNPQPWCHRLSPALEAMLRLLHVCFRCEASDQQGSGLVWFCSKCLHLCSGVCPHETFQGHCWERTKLLRMRGEEIWDLKPNLKRPLNIPTWKLWPAPFL